MMIPESAEPVVEEVQNCEIVCVEILNIKKLIPLGGSFSYFWMFWAEWAMGKHFYQGSLSAC